MNDRKQNPAIKKIFSKSCTLWFLFCRSNIQICQYLRYWPHIRCQLFLLYRTYIYNDNIYFLEVCASFKLKLLWHVNTLTRTCTSYVYSYMFSIYLLIWQNNTMNRKFAFCKRIIHRWQGKRKWIRVWAKRGWRYWKREGDTVNIQTSVDDIYI